MALLQVCTESSWEDCSSCSMSDVAAGNSDAFEELFGSDVEAVDVMEAVDVTPEYILQMSSQLDSLMRPDLTLTDDSREKMFPVEGPTVDISNQSVQHCLPFVTEAFNAVAAIKDRIEGHQAVMGEEVRVVDQKLAVAQQLAQEFESRKQDTFPLPATQGEDADPPALLRTSDSEDYALKESIQAEIEQMKVNERIIVEPP